MSKLTKMLIICILAMVITSCAMTSERRACFNIPPEQSILCQYMGDIWEETTLVVRVSNAAMIQEGVYSAEEALKLVKDLKSILEPTPGVPVDNVLYSTFFKYVAKKAGPLVAVTLSESINEFYTVDIPITPFDVTLIMNELNKNEMNIDLFLATESAKKKE